MYKSGQALNPHNAFKSVYVDSGSVWTQKNNCFIKQL